MRKGWFLLSLVGLASGIGYILMAHPPVAGAVMVLLIAVVLCSASWVMGG